MIYWRGNIHTGLGDKDKALEQLNRAYEDRAGWIVYLNVEPIFDPIRSALCWVGETDEVSAIAASPET